MGPVEAELTSYGKYKRNVVCDCTLGYRLMMVELCCFLRFWSHEVDPGSLV
jgi:hypothetical protein